MLDVPKVGHLTGLLMLQARPFMPISGKRGFAQYKKGAAK